MKKEKNYRDKKHILYPIADFLFTFGIDFLVFITTLWKQGFTNIQWIFTIVYLLFLSLLLLIVLFIFKVYKMLTRDFGMREAINISLIVLCVQAVGIIPLFLVDHQYLPDTSKWVYILATICLMFMIPSLRLSSRVFRMIDNHRRKKERNVNTLIIGAGSAAKIVIDDIKNNKQSKNKIICIVDDDVTLIGSSFINIPIKGQIINVPDLVKEYEIEEVIIAISSLEEKRYREILEILFPLNVRVKKLPSLLQMNGPNDKRVTVVNLDDLLCRKPIVLDNESLSSLLNKNIVLITGAGGSIGSELSRQIFNTHPSKLILFDIYENSTYEIEQELKGRIRKEGIKDIELITLIGSTYDYKRMEHIISKYKPNYIYHAAAYKHVPLMEDSPIEAIRTNVIGTYNVAKLANKYKVNKMILVSTDKAVRPTNVMGATKRFAETIIQYFSKESKYTSYAAVRFGNVLGSNGSVVPLFTKQIEAKGPLTITDKRIIRYFMTIPEAVSLILQCSIYAKEGEIFILDMGKPVKILDLAEKMIRQAGYITYKDINIIEVGLRPGEKLYEELLLDPTRQIRTDNEKIYIENKEDIYPIEKEMEEISKAFDLENNDDIKDMLGSIIDTYKRI